MTNDDPFFQSKSSTYTEAEKAFLDRGARALEAATKLAAELGVSITHLHDGLELRGPPDACKRVHERYAWSLVGYDHVLDTKDDFWSLWKKDGRLVPRHL